MYRTSRQNSYLGKFFAPCALSATLLAGIGCNTPAAPAPAAAPVSSARSSALGGQEGPLEITAPNTIVNRYAALAVDAAAGSAELTVTSAADLMPLAQGDLILIIQMQGAEMDATDSEQYGALTNLNGAGQYEFAIVDGVNGDTISLSDACTGLHNSYSAAAHVQIVRVPQVTSLTITDTGSLTAPAWNGKVGGVVAVHAIGDAQIDGAIDVSGQGFRGGSVDAMSRPPALDIALFASADSADGAEKGEGIAGAQADYDALGGRYGRGAPGNAGGGANAFKSGGGGGANAANGLPWTGRGVMDAANGAWQLDPVVAANGGQCSASGGGGRGGYTQSIAAADPMMDAPGAGAWGGGERRDRGGLGGRPIEATSADRIFFGGGGGAGDAPDGGGGPGGNGGGIVYLMAHNVKGAGQIMGNGTAGVDTTGAHSDGTGGGGGGGTLVIHADAIDSVGMLASGGRGGNQFSVGAEAQGPGGGGGGGVVASIGRQAYGAAVGGQAGINTSPTMAAFQSNGATLGSLGVGNGTHDIGRRNPLCMPADIEVSVRSTADSVVPGTTAVLSFAVTNRGPTPILGAQLSDEIADGLGDRSWSCTPILGGACAQTSGFGPVRTAVDLAPGEAAVIEVRVAVPSKMTNPIAYSLAAAPSVVLTDLVPANNRVVMQNLLAPQADLRTWMHLSQTKSAPGAAAELIMHVANAGPSAARAVKAQLKLPIGATVKQTQNDGWLCVMEAEMARCSRENLEMGEESEIKIAFAAPAKIGKQEIAVSVGTDAIDDPQLGNNNASADYEVLNQPAEQPVDPMMESGGGCSATGPVQHGPHALLLGIAALMARLLPRRRRRA